MIRFLYIGALALLFLGSVAAQTPKPTPANSEINEKEKAEIREFTKDFLRHLRKTRDVRPLVPKYFAKDFETFVYHFLLSDSPDRANAKPPGPALRKRLALASLNFMAVYTPYTVISLDFEKELPPRLRRQYQRFFAFSEGHKDEDSFLPSKRTLRRMESLNRAMADHLRSHPVELTEKYKAKVKGREAIDDYN